jgi:hypothetical protein
MSIKNDTKGDIGTIIEKDIKARKEFNKNKIINVKDRRKKQLEASFIRKNDNIVDEFNKAIERGDIKNQSIKQLAQTAIDKKDINGLLQLEITDNDIRKFIESIINKNVTSSQYNPTQNSSNASIEKIKQQQTVLAKFNNTFDKAKDKLKKYRNDNIIANKPIYEYSVYEIFTGISNTWFGILDDLISFNLNNILTRNNRLFFIGLTLIIICTLIYVCLELFNKIDLIIAPKNRTDLSTAQKN